MTARQGTPAELAAMRGPLVRIGTDQDVVVTGRLIEVGDDIDAGYVLLATTGGNIAIPLRRIATYTAVAEAAR